MQMERVPRIKKKSLSNCKGNDMIRATKGLQAVMEVGAKKGG